MYATACKHHASNALRQSEHRAGIRQDLSNKISELFKLLDSNDNGTLNYVEIQACAHPREDILTIIPETRQDYRISCT